MKGASAFSRYIDGLQRRCDAPRRRGAILGMRSACATASALALLCACATAAPVEGDGHGGGLITQPEVLDLVGCSCVDKFIDAQLSATARKPWSSPSPYAGIHRGDRGYAWRSAANGTETPPRLYYFNQERSTNAGLHHQRSNLKTGIIMEGLLLGRAVVLGAIPLDKNHNFNLPIVRNRWSDYVSLDKSTFVLRDRRNGGREVCKGTLASCVADLHADQHAVLRAAAHMRVPYIDTVMAAQNAAEPFLERNATLPGRKPDVNLIRRMPPWRAHQDNYEIAIDWSPSHHIRRTVKEILAELERRSTTGKVAVVHVRRGDKLSKAKYCGDQIAMATSPAHIAKVLGRIGLPPGTTLYIMSNEENWCVVGCGVGWGGRGGARHGAPQWGAAGETREPA